MSCKRALSLITLVVACILFLCPMATVAADPIPRPAGDIYVQDFANVLSPQEKSELIQYGKKIDDQTTNQIAVLTVNNLGGMDIEEFANKAYRQYGLGTKEKDNGVLLVLAMKEKKVRIEVGYGLEGKITDGDAGSILDQYAIPYLKAGQPNQAILHTYQALGKEVTGKNADLNQQPSKQQEQAHGTSIPSWLIIVLVIAFFIIDFMFFGGTLSFALLSILGRGGGGGGGGPRGGGGGSSGGGGASRGW